MLAPGEWRAVFLAPDREELYRRIDARFDAMMEAGAIEEVRALAARGLDPALPAMRAHGVPGLIAWLRGGASREEAVARGKLDTRALFQAPVHLRPPSTAGLSLGADRPRRRRRC